MAKYDMGIYTSFVYDHKWLMKACTHVVTFNGSKCDLCTASYTVVFISWMLIISIIWYLGVNICIEYNCTVSRSYHQLECNNIPINHIIFI